MFSKAESGQVQGKDSMAWFLWFLLMVWDCLVVFLLAFLLSCFLAFLLWNWKRKEEIEKGEEAMKKWKNEKMKKWKNEKMKKWKNEKMKKWKNEKMKKWKQNKPRVLDLLLFHLFIFFPSLFCANWPKVKVFLFYFTFFFWNLIFFVLFCFVLFFEIWNKMKWQQKTKWKSKIISNGIVGWWCWWLVVVMFGLSCFKKNVKRKWKSRLKKCGGWHLRGFKLEWGGFNISTASIFFTTLHFIFQYFI